MYKYKQKHWYTETYTVHIELEEKQEYREHSQYLPLSI